ncbi:MAG: site-specific integrase [Pseudomonadota bacterium]
MGERLPEYLEPGEIKKVLSIPDKRCKIGFRDYLILRLLAETGIRRGELAGMKIGNLVSHNGGYSLFFPSLKKRKVRGEESHKEKKSNREIPLKHDLFSDLQRYLKQEYNGSNTDKDLPLFRTSGKHGPYKKTSITPKAIYDLVKRYTEQAGIEKRITPHSFRHTAATNWLVSGSDLATVKELLGHEHISSTEVYLNTSWEKMRGAIEGVNYSA